ncbi:MAG: formimidoylglutamase [Halolamina sp.]
MTVFSDHPSWHGPSTDPQDEQFGDIVEPTDLDAAGAYDAVLVGEPYDGAVIGRQGAREGPAGIRDALAGVKSHHFGTGPVGSVGDLGDLDIPESEDVAAVQAQVREAMAEVHALEAVPICLGGDNSLSFANVVPLVAGEESVGAISFDAHLDCRAVPEDGPNSGTPYRQLHEEGLDGFAVVGARHFETSTAYAEYVERHGGSIVTAEKVGRDIDAALEQACAAMAGVDQVYLSVDIDVLDAAHGPGVSAPTPGGLTPRELFDLVHQLATDERLVGVEVVECAPRLDESERTTRAAARTVAHAVAGLGSDASTTG